MGRFFIKEERAKRKERREGEELKEQRAKRKERRGKFLKGA